MITITPRKMIDFKALYDAGHYRHQRFGQAFCNHFDISFSTLFYTESRREAEAYIWLHFVS